MTIEDGKSGASEGAPGHTRYYITTAIDYPNAPPHIGHALEKVIADVIARYHRLLGDDTYFSMGLDENSQHVLRAAQEHGDIYRDTYSGWYCPNCNTFYTSDELVDGHCPLHPSITPEWLEEENYFFALSKYSERLLTHIETHPEFIVPAQRRAEVVGLIRQGLRDFSVSRQVRPGMETWGVPIPGDPQQVIYVWFDALTNYLTAVGFPDDASKFARYWP